jgi:hypothetical protein
MRITTPVPSTQTAGNLFASIVKWITLAGMAAVHSMVHRAARADFNVRAGQGRTGVILRRRPCFLPAGLAAKLPRFRGYASASHAGDLCFAGLSAEWVFQQIPSGNPP